MEKQHFDDFIKIFRHLENAALIISEEFYKPRVKQEIDEIEQVVDLLSDSNSPLFKNVLKEIEQNLHSPSVSNEPYLLRILRPFVGIAPYLNIVAVHEYGIELGKQIVKIDGQTYPNSLAILHITLIRREAWRNHGWDEVPITIPEKYAILCFRAFRDFINHLDAIFLNFNIDLMEIQSRNHLQIWERDTSALTRLGYTGEYIKNLKNDHEPENSIPSQIKESKKDELPEKLESLFESISKYKTVMEILVTKELIHSNTYLWKDETKGNKAFLAALIKDLRGKKYFKADIQLTPVQIKNICVNSFGWKIAIDTIKHAKAENFDFSFIPLSSTIPQIQNTQNTQNTSLYIA